MTDDEYQITDKNKTLSFQERDRVRFFIGRTDIPVCPLGKRQEWLFYHSSALTVHSPRNSRADTETCSYIHSLSQTKVCGYHLSIFLLLFSIFLTAPPI